MKNNKTSAVIIGMFLALGAGIGTAVGAATGNIGLWLAIGIAIGTSLGTATYIIQKADSDHEEGKVKK